MRNNKGLFVDIFQRYDRIKFVHRNDIYTGYIGRVFKNKIKVYAKPVDVYDQELGPIDTWFFRDQDFANFNIEWLDEHRGCDNSAIGVSPSWSDMSWITEHFKNHA